MRLEEREAMVVNKNIQVKCAHIHFYFKTVAENHISMKIFQSKLNKVYVDGATKKSENADTCICKNLSFLDSMHCTSMLFFRFFFIFFCFLNVSYYFPSQWH